MAFRIYRSETKQRVVKINNVSRVTFYTAQLVIILIGGPDACGFNELLCRTTSATNASALSLGKIQIFNEDHLQGSLTLPESLSFSSILSARVNLCG